MEGIIYSIDRLLSLTIGDNIAAFDIHYVNIAMLVWGCVFCLIAGSGMILSKNFDNHKRLWMILMQFATAVLLLSDAAACIFRGCTGPLGYWIVRISNFIVFVDSDIILYLFHRYVCSFIFTQHEERTLKRARFMNLLCAVAVILVIVSQFTDLYYYYDDQNIYHRSPGYIIAMLVPVTGMMVEMSFLIQYRKKLSNITISSLSSYIILPTIAAVIQFFFYGISLINIAICNSMMVMYITVMCDQNRKLNNLEQKQIKTQAELEISMVLNQCIAELTTEADIDIAIQNLLAIINNYFGADRCYIFESNYDSNTMDNTYEYVSNGITAQKDNLQKLSMNIISLWMERFKEEKPYYIADVSKQKEEPIYSILREQNVDRLLAVPLKRDGDIIGFLGVDNPANHYEDAALLSSIQYFVTNSLEKRVQQEKMRYLSYRDMLTGLYNRNKYISIVTAFKDQTLENVGVAYIDLNGLKAINDNYGHAKGDKFICAAADILKSVFPNNAYRVGGDEFVIVIQNIECDKYEERITALKNIMQDKQVSISIGVLWREQVDDLEALLKSADKLMYVEKEMYHKNREQS